MPMPHRPLLPALLALSLTLASGPAYASLASETFSDVPDGHWAQEGVTEVAIRRDLMRGFPDGTFRGEQAFTRLQLAYALKELVREIEEISKARLTPTSRFAYNFADLPPGPDREMVLALANEYGLFERVPGILGHRFEPDRQVTRYEMAKVIDNLMRAAERRDIVRVRDQDPRYTFTDVGVSDWARQEVHSVANRYGVMVGFPDQTFRGRDELTRYQFAQAAHQTVPLIHKLVASTAEAKEEERRAREMGRRWQERTPWHLELRSGLPTLGAGLRYIGYGNGFFISDTRVVTGPAGLTLDEQLGWSPWETFLGGAQVQPYLGLRLAAASLTQTPAFYGGIGPGLAAYWRLSPRWGFSAHARGSYLFSGAGSAFFLDTADLEAEYFALERLAVTAGFGFQEELQTMVVSPVLKAGLTWSF